MPWTTAGAEVGKYDLWNVATHEVGHFAGMGHVGDPKSACIGCIGSTAVSIQTMYWEGTTNDITRRSLDWGDKSGIRYLYPRRFVAVDSTATGTNTGVGSVTGGADAAFGRINSATGQPDLLVGWIKGGGTGVQNTIYYRIGWDFSSSSGSASSWSSIRTAVDSTATGDRAGVGTASDGLGIALATIDGDSVPDLLVAWVDAPSGANKIYYRIGWDLSTTGIPASWSPIRTAGGGASIGDRTGDIGVCVRDIKSSTPTKQEMVVAWTDGLDGANKVRYVIGYDMNLTSGVPASWSARQEMAGGSYWVGSETDGTGLACSDFDTGGLDYLLSWIDGRSGNNQIVYRVGRNIPSTGIASSWTPTPGGDVGSTKRGPGLSYETMGSESQGLGLAFGDIDGSESDDVAFVWVDDASGENTIYYWVEWNGKYNSHP
jgi:hypothetical protein